MVFPDNDPPGHQYAAAIQRKALEAGALQVSVRQWPGVPLHGDAVEWLAAGGTSAAFAELLGDLTDSISTGPSGPDGPSPILTQQEGADQGHEGPGPGGPSTTVVDIKVPAVREIPLHAPPPSPDFPSVDGYLIENSGVYEVTKKADIQLTFAPCGVIAHCRDGRRENWGGVSALARPGWHDS